MRWTSVSTLHVEADFNHHAFHRLSGTDRAVLGLHEPRCQTREPILRRVASSVVLEAAARLNGYSRFFNDARPPLAGELPPATRPAL